MRNILIIDDDPEIPNIISVACSLELPCSITHADTAAKGIAHATNNSCDLIILDLTLPDMSGLDVCKKLREQGVQFPVICLTSRADPIDKIVGFENGADDYVIKPFNPRELIARIKAVLRRTDGSTTATTLGDDDELTIGELRIVKNARRVFINTREIELSRSEFDILVLLAANPGKVYPREELLTQVLGYTTNEYDHSITSHVCRIRSKIEKDPDRPVYIRTARGVGYRFATAEELSLA